MTIVRNNGALAPIGPYSHATIIGELVYTSGQIALDPNSGAVVGNDVQAQTHRVLQNLKIVLEAAGSDLSHVIKTTCFLLHMDDFSLFNDVYATYFTASPPSRSCVAVKTLPKNTLVEVEAIAMIKNTE